MNPPQDFVHTYFDRAASPDQQAYVDLFAASAQVRDDGGAYHGLEEIRAWRSNVPAVSYDVLGIAEHDGIITSRAAVSGDFPGSPVTLTFRFDLDENGTIRSLDIHP